MLGLVIWRLQLCHTWSGVNEIARSVWLARRACTGMQWLHIITDEVIWSYLSVSVIKVQSDDHSSFDVNCQPQKNNLKFSHSHVEFSIIYNLLVYCRIEHDIFMKKFLQNVDPFNKTVCSYACSVAISYLAKLSQKCPFMW